MVLLAPQTRLWKCMWTVVGLCGFVVVRAYTEPELLWFVTC
jgi:hypothetical protein